MRYMVFVLVVVGVMACRTPPPKPAPTPVYDAEGDVEVARSTVRAVTAPVGPDPGWIVDLGRSCVEVKPIGEVLIEIDCNTNRSSETTATDVIVLVHKDDWARLGPPPDKRGKHPERENF